MNHFFQFKNFLIQQEYCAMKVTETACIQGAWTPVPAAASRIMDIGSGTGLLSLMLAQRFAEVQIDAVEIDELSYRQSVQNIENSIFKDRISVSHADIKTFNTLQPYDFIICNPPFFENQLKSPLLKKNGAWHSEQLLLHELIACIGKLLSPQGSFSIVLPAIREEEIKSICAKCNFYAERILQIRHTDQHAINHFVFIFCRQQTTCQTELLTVKESGLYTEAFLQMMRAFYLKL
ncbi:MAG: methyltransferase [Chitinophagaceae bacterium]|nr:methyltransferase [Chitinophagaceae bacterium]